MVENILGALIGDPFAVMNTIGLVAFAFVGSSKAIREEFDVFGITIVGLAMAFAGGVTRDLLVRRVPLAIQSPIEIILGLIGVGLAIALGVVFTTPETHPFTIVSDAIGLAAFTTTGIIVATEAGLPVFGIIAMGTINAVGGGAFADILLDRSPFILFEDFYATCTVLGGCAYWIIGMVGATGSAAAIVCSTVTVVTRLAAVTFDWNLPTVQKI